MGGVYMSPPHSIPLRQSVFFNCLWNINGRKSQSKWCFGFYSFYALSITVLSMSVIWTLWSWNRNAAYSVEALLLVEATWWGQPMVPLSLCGSCEASGTIQSVFQGPAVYVINRHKHPSIQTYSKPHNKKTQTQTHKHKSLRQPHTTDKHTYINR